MAKRITYKVHGTVQGVFFRAFTEERARVHGLTGFVKNTADGKVIGEAQGDESSLQSFLKDLNQGPKHAHIFKVEQLTVELNGGESSFVIN